MVPLSSAWPRIGSLAVKLASTVKPCFSNTSLVIWARSCSSAKPLPPTLIVPLPLLLELPDVGHAEEPPVELVLLLVPPQPASIADQSSTRVRPQMRGIIMFSLCPQLEGSKSARRGRAPNLLTGLATTPAPRPQEWVAGGRNRWRR